jgi:hypothetical protein
VVPLQLFQWHHPIQKDLDLLNIKAEKEDLLKALEKEKVKCEKLHVQMMENEGKSKSHTEVMLQQIEMESLELTELKSENLKLSDDVKILTDENSKLSKTLTQAMKEKETLFHFKLRYSVFHCYQFCIFHF